MLRSRFFDKIKKSVICKHYSDSSSDHENIKRIKFRKRLASTILFGSTFIAAIWCKKRRKSQAFQESSLLTKNLLYRSNVMLYNYRGFVFPSFVMKNMDALKKFQCKEDDIFVVSFPKTGTTWLQEIIYCIMEYGDLETIKKSIEDRFPYLEFIYPGLSSIEKQSDQRFIKTHIPYSLLPPDVFEKKPKIFYIIRNPKDVTVSYYHFIRMLTITNYVGSFEDFFGDMINDKVPYGPMWKHYNDIWDHKEDENVMILFYEDLHQDTHNVIKKVAEFLGKSLSDAEIENVATHCSFLKMSSNPSVNYEHWDDLGVRIKDEAKFMRKGKVGDWRNYFTMDLSNEMDRWADAHFKNVGLNFKYELKKKNMDDS